MKNITLEKAEAITGAATTEEQGKNNKAVGIESVAYGCEKIQHQDLLVWSVVVSRMRPLIP